MTKHAQLLVVLVAVSLLPHPGFAQLIPVDSMYLGQTPPGNTPVVFTLPTSSGLRPVERLAISTDGTEIYFGELDTYPPTAQNTKCMKYINDRWQGPFDVFAGYAAPRLTVNDSTMYIQSNIGDFSMTSVSHRTAGGWSPPVRLLATAQQTHYFQTTSSGNSYLSSNLPATPSQRDICRLVVNGTDSLIVGLGKPINTAVEENDLFVADDESYLLFSRNTSPAGDMYLSIRRPDGRWTNPKRLPEPINRPGNYWDYGQFVSKDGKYLFFTSGGAMMSSYFTYWVRIDNLIDSMRHANFVPYLNQQIPSMSVSQGHALAYTFPDTTFIDDDGNNTLAYTATLSNGNPLPAWLSFDPATRMFAGTPTAAAIHSIKVVATDTAGATASCTFVISVTLTDVRQTEEEIPGRVELYQNYPNPFNPTTTIGFVVPRNGRYALRLYDVLGVMVKDIADREFRAGLQSEMLDATGLSSGVYMYRLTGEKTNLVRKMLLLR
jgi:hypothetical protein